MKTVKTSVLCTDLLRWINSEREGNITSPPALSSAEKFEIENVGIQRCLHKNVLNCEPTAIKPQKHIVTAFFIKLNTKK